MLKVKDSKGRPCEISVYGSHDDPSIDEAYYTDVPDDVAEEVPENEIEYIQNNYAAEIGEEIYEQAVARAEAWADAQQDR